MSNHILGTNTLKLLFCLSPLVLFFWAAGNCSAQDQVVRVEEDWKMVLGEPEPESVAPQVTCVISPTDNVNSLYAAFTLNHRGLPEFQPGGLQLQIWNNETSVQTKDSPNTSVLSQTNETVTWTQSMELKDGLLTFEIVSGNSATWGVFGDQGYLKANVNTSLSNLNNYSPTVSIRNSGIGFASNRVNSLVIKRVRLILSTGAIIEDNTLRVVYQQQE